MTLTLTRTSQNPAAVIGSLQIDGVPFCHTLEDPDDIFPAGTYEGCISYSPKFKRNLPELLNVPGRSYIRIHSGNDEGDTEGCILVGFKHDESRIWESRLAETALMKKLPSKFTIQVTNAI